jgi:regulation of enolase protein 1 (concanavalin A-like superfamily)
LVGSTYTLVGTTTAASFQDTGLSPQTTYSYRVYSYNAGGESAGFSSASATTPAGPVTVPAAPTNLVATPASATQVNLSWTDNSNNETGFHVYRLIGSTYTLVGTTTAASFQDTGLSAQTTYSYRVFAYNSAGESATFAAGQATTPAASSLPSPWVDGDVGTVSATGSATYSNGTFSVTGSGSDIWTTADGFNFVYQQMTGDGTIIAKVTGITNTNGWAKAGVMMRETLAAGAKEAAMHVTPTNGTVMTYRTATGGSSDGSFASSAAPEWVKLVRSGNTFTASQSTDGNTWTQVGTISISMSSTIYVGLCVSAKSTTATATGTFTNVSLNGVASAPATVSPLTAAPATTTSSSTFSPTAIPPLATLDQQDVIDRLHA